MQIRLRVARESDHCDYTHTFQIVEYEPITVRYTAFIPCEIIEGPTQPLPPAVEFLGLGHAFYGGDDREFSAIAAQYRVGYHATISMGDQQVADPPSAVPLFNDPGYSVFGTSRGYNDQAGLPSNAVPGCPWRLIPGAQAEVTTVLVPDGQNWRFTRTQVASNSALVHFHARASNPAFPLPSPPIRVEMELDPVQEVHEATGQQGMPYVLLSGRRTMFPAHEVWINEHRIHAYDPRVEGIGPLEGLALFPLIIPEGHSFSLP